MFVGLVVTELSIFNGAGRGRELDLHVLPVTYSRGVQLSLGASAVLSWVATDRCGNIVPAGRTGTEMQAACLDGSKCFSSDGAPIFSSICPACVLRVIRLPIAELLQCLAVLCNYILHRLH